MNSSYRTDIQIAKRNIAAHRQYAEAANRRQSEETGSTRSAFLMRLWHKLRWNGPAKGRDSGLAGSKRLTNET